MVRLPSPCCVKIIHCCVLVAYEVVRGLFEGLISSKFVNHDIKDIGILNRFSDATNYTNNNKQGVKALDWTFHSCLHPCGIRLYFSFVEKCPRLSKMAMCKILQSQTISF